MPNTIPANGGAMPAKAFSRRAALGAFASVSALAIPAAAVALTLPSATTTLAELIKAHVTAKAAFYVEIDAVQAAEPGYHTPFECMGYPDLKVGCRPDDLLKTADDIFDREVTKFAKLEKLAPDIAATARTVRTGACGLPCPCERIVRRLPGSRSPL